MLLLQMKVRPSPCCRPEKVTSSSSSSSSSSSWRRLVYKHVHSLCFIQQLQDQQVEMKLKVLLWLVALLLPHSADCRPVDAPAGRHLLLPRPLLLHLGEEFSLRLGGGGGASSAAPDLLPSSSSSSSSSSAVNRALLQLTQRLLQARAEQQEEVQEEEEKGKRSEEPPISLDLTFHLLRGVLEMARAEQLAQQADSNRKMMDDLGK